MLGHKADLGVMALGPDLARLQAFQQELLDRRRSCPSTRSSRSPSSPSTRTTEDDERARLEREEGLIGDAADVESRSRAWRERIAHYRENRMHPQLPAKAAARLLPDVEAPRRATPTGTSCRSTQRKELMAGHARVGRTYAGRVLQLITGSTGLDDWEWGVTLLADDPVALKDIVHEMRFDPGVGALRRVRPVLHRAGAAARRGVRARRAARRAAADDDA